jgi:putative ABC transport system permease protein
LLTDAFLAARNIARQRRRSAFALAAIAFGVAALIVANGFIDWIMFKHRETTITSQYGHIQVTRKGYFEEGTADPFGYLLPKSLTRPGHHRTAPGAARSRQTSGVQRPGEQRRRNRLFRCRGRRTGQGAGPEQFAADSQRCTNLSADDPNGIILGLGLAANLGIDVGDTVVLMANTATGSVNAVECRVRGFFATMSKAYDDVALRVPLTIAHRLLKVDGAHTWALLLTETEQAGPTLRTLRQRFANESLVFTEWIELADFHVKAVSLLAKQAGVMRVIIAVIIVLSIFNTMMMSVMERTGEIGTAMALGLTRRGILRMIVVEGAMLGIVGGLLGLALGTLLAWVISRIGIPMPPPPGQSWGFLGEVMVTGRLAADAFLLAVGSTLVASIIPARTASGMVIVDALRFNR